MEPWPAMLVLQEGYSLRPFKATLFGEKRGWDGYYHWCSENKSNSWKQRVLWWAIYKELKEVESWVKDLNLPKFVGISMVLTEMELRSILFFLHGPTFFCFQKYPFWWFHLTSPEGMWIIPLKNASEDSVFQCNRLDLPLTRDASHHQDNYIYYIFRLGNPNINR